MTTDMENNDNSASDGFGGLRVAAFESRRCEEMERMIRQQGGQAFVSPSMREVPIEDQAQAVDFANLAMTGQVDILIVLTGVGFEMLMQAVSRRVDQERFVNALRDMITMARGPKPVAAMRKFDIKPTHRVAEPNTWREILSLVDSRVPVANSHVVIQEYGRTNRSLLAGLEARGARVTRLPIYGWELPQDLGPLQSNAGAIAGGQRDVLMFTSAHQIVNLLRVGQQLDVSVDLLRGMRECVICSIGPTTSEELQVAGLAADFEPTIAKMGHFVVESARAAAPLLARKRRIFGRLSGPAGQALDPEASWYQGPFMRACRGEPVEHTPIWLMRQAGRYLPQYRQIREQVSFLELCKRPDLCAQIMVETVERLGVDAAIVFSDLLPILEPMGLDLEYSAGDGPVIHNPIRERTDIDRLRPLDSIDSLHFVCEAVAQTRAGLPTHVPLIGFAGAPFTLASYAIEGGGSRNFLHTKTLMRRDATAWRELMQRLTQSIILYLNAQISSGAQCVQLFDSWAGCLSPDEYRSFVLPFMREIVTSLRRRVPVISFATGNPELLPCLAEAQPTIVGVDWRISLAAAWKRIGYQRGVQGNLDPTALFADVSEVRQAARQILNSVAGRPGHIFNLGHGVLPQTPVDNVLALIDEVHAFRARTSRCTTGSGGNPFHRIERNVRQLAGITSVSKMEPESPSRSVVTAVWFSFTRSVCSRQAGPICLFCGKRDPGRE